MQHYDGQEWSKLVTSLQKDSLGMSEVLDFFGAGVRARGQLPMWALMVLPSPLL